MKDIGTLRREIRKAYKIEQNWRRVAAEFGISAGMAWRIAREGYEPRDVDIRLRLRLPAYVQVAVCAKCGEAHGERRRCRRARREPAKITAWTPQRLRWALENREEAWDDEKQD